MDQLVQPGCLLIIQMVQTEKISHGVPQHTLVDAILQYHLLGMQYPYNVHLTFWDLRYNKVHFIF